MNLYRYSLTTNKYHCNSDLLENAKSEFGSTAVLADWKDIKEIYGDDIEAFCNDI
jgi:DNA-binding ferritin-like protein (Dps family)